MDVRVAVLESFAERQVVLNDRMLDRLDRLQNTIFNASIAVTVALLGIGGGIIAKL